MKIVGTIERLRINEEKKIVEIILQTAEENPNYLTITYFIREGREFSPVKIGDIVVVEASLKGRRWTDPESGEVRYFMSLNASKIINLKGDHNEN